MLISVSINNILPCHILRGRFVTLDRNILGDGELARGLHKLGRTTPAAAAPNRNEILPHIRDHYLIEN